MKDQQLWRWAFWAILVVWMALPPVTGYLFPFYYDDAFISFRITENLAQTGFPYFSPGEPVFTSTSLVYPIWNCLWFFAFGKNWIYLIPVLNGGLISIFYLWLGLKIRGLSPSFFLSFLVLLFLSPAAFSLYQLGLANSGLETALYQIVLLMVLFPGKKKWISWFPFWVRPEGILATIARIIADFGNGERPKKNLYLAALASLAGFIFLCLFWFGTMVPQSILAKANHWIDRQEQILKGVHHLFFSYYGFYAISIASAWLIIQKLRSLLLPGLIWITFYVSFFSFIAMWWPWYVPPLMACIMVLSSFSFLFLFIEFENFLKNKQKFVLLISVVMGIVSLFTLNKTLSQLEKQSEAISIRLENGKKIGFWLNNNIPHDKNILLEPLGIIGYFGRHVNILDYPGLTSPKMSKFIHKKNEKIPVYMTSSSLNSKIVENFKPDYIMCREAEEISFKSGRFFFENYELKDSLNYFPPVFEYRKVNIYRLKD